MSDNEIMQNNVVQFPQTSAQEGIPSAPVGDEKQIISAEKLAEKAMNSQEYVMKLIDKNRKKGIEQVQVKLEKLTERDLHPDPSTESALRDAQAAVQGLLTWGEAINSLTDFIKHDLIAMVTNMQQQGAQAWQTAAHLQTLIELLKEKQVVSEQELRTTWDRLIVPGAKAQVATEPDPK